MIDIHSHVLFSVDDGSKNLEQSLKYLQEAKKMGVNKVVCTPHMSHGRDEKIDLIVKNFKLLRKGAAKLGIELFLGNEILIKDKTVKLLKERKIIGLKDTKYVLVEFKRNENKPFDDILVSLTDIADHGFIPILAHPEFYSKYRNIKYIKLLKDNGILIQVDGTSLLKTRCSFKTYSFCKKLIKERLVDFVASDCHCTKKRDYKSLKKAYIKVRRMDKKYADIIFKENQLEIVGE